MTQNAKSKHPIPEGYSTVTPWIITHDTAKLIDYLKATFDAKELGRVTNPDGLIGHAEVRIGDSACYTCFYAPVCRRW